MMDQEDLRRQLELQIAELSRARRATADADAKAEIKAEMDRLRNAVDVINVEAGRQLRDRIEEILRKLEEVRVGRGLDAVTSLGIAIEGLRDVREQL